MEKCKTTGDGAPAIPSLRGAIIGFGAVAERAHLPVWRRDARFRIAAVIEPSDERLRLARRLLPEAGIHSDMESLAAAAKGFDFVDICTPPCFHEELILAAFRAGLHVFCEKPLLPVPGGLGRLREAADAAKTVLFVVNNWKYAPLWAKAVEIVQRGEIGRIKALSLSVLRTPGPGGGISDWRGSSRIAGGGILLDHGWHNLYLILALMNDYPTGVSARMEYDEKGDPGLEETVRLVLRFPAAEARLHLTRCAARRGNHGVVTGTRGILRINDDHLLLETGNAPPVRYDFHEPLSGGSHHPEWMRAVIGEFYREVLSSRRCGTNFTEAGWCAGLIDLAYRSHRANGSFMEPGEALSRHSGPRTVRMP